jgi:hypothetical protein
VFSQAPGCEDVRECKVYFYVFLTLALDEGKWLASRLGFFNLRRPMKRRLGDSQNRSPRFGEEEEIGNLTLSRSHLAHGTVTIPTELYRFLALAEPALITPPSPPPPERRSRNLD